MEEDDYAKIISGNIGESYVYRHIKYTSVIQGYRKQLRNVTIPYNKGITEIDTIMIHTKGIFVIESKNLNGVISGKANDKNWTQQVKDKPLRPFQNPIFQNKLHIKALSKFLSTDAKNMISVIAFKDSSKLIIPVKNKGNLIITKREKMTHAIRDLLKDHPDVFSEKEVDDFYETLASTD